jgi:hypothetical protein
VTGAKAMKTNFSSPPAAFFATKPQKRRPARFNYYPRFQKLRWRDGSASLFCSSQPAMKKLNLPIVRSSGAFCFRGNFHGGGFHSTLAMGTNKTFQISK